MDRVPSTGLGAGKKAEGHLAERQAIAYAAWAGWAASTEPGQSQTRGEQWFGPVPDTGEMAYLVGWIYSLGGLGKNLSWHEIKAWSELTGIIPTPSECATMINMSNVFASEMQAGFKKGANVPQIAQEYMQW